MTDLLPLLPPLSRPGLKRALLGLALSIARGFAAHADIVVPGANGSDGTLNITTNTVIDLSQAVTGNWDTNNAANAGKGVYDPEKWAVVFKYSEVAIAPDATVSFKNHPSRAPVVWLVNGDVRVGGTVRLSGENGLPSPRLAEPGPGGFRGGTGYYSSGAGLGSGFGVGGGAGGVAPDNNGGTFGRWWWEL
jgi:hypothetical protein